MFTWVKKMFRGRRSTVHRELFQFGQAVQAEEYAAELAEDLAEIGQRKLATLASIMKTAVKFDDGSKLMQEAAQAYRDGIAAILTQPIVTGDDPEGRIEALSRPFEDSMSSPELSVNGSKVAPKALPNGTPSHESPGPNSHPPDDPSTSPPPKKRGRPTGSRNRPKPPEDNSSSQS